MPAEGEVEVDDALLDQELEDLVSSSGMSSPVVCRYKRPCRYREVICIYHNKCVRLPNISTSEKCCLPVTPNTSISLVLVSSNGGPRPSSRNSNSNSSSSHNINSNILDNSDDEGGTMGTGDANNSSFGSTGSADNGGGGYGHGSNDTRRPSSIVTAQQLAGLRGQMVNLWQVGGM